MWRLIKNLCTLRCCSCRLYCGANWNSPHTENKYQNFSQRNRNPSHPSDQRYVGTKSMAFASSSRIRVMKEEDYFHYRTCLISDPTEVCTFDLPFVPTACVRYKDEVYFVDNLLSNWWTTLIRNRDKIPKLSLFPVVYNLYKINSATNGGVLMIVKWNEIEEFVEYILKDLNQPVSTLSKYSALVNGLSGFVNDFGVECSATLQNHLLSVLSTWLLYVNSINKVYLTDVVRQIGTILHYLVQIGIEKPNEELLKKIILLCRESLKFSKSQSGDFIAFLNLVRCAEALTMWNVNMDASFWHEFFMCIKSHFNNVLYLNSLFLWLTLHYSLLVAYKFDTEEDFMIIRNMWLKDMHTLLNDKPKKFSFYLNMRQTKNLIERMKLKYADKPSKLETILSPEILKKFDEL